MLKKIIIAVLVVSLLVSALVSLSCDTCQTDITTITTTATETQPPTTTTVTVTTQPPPTTTTVTVTVEPYTGLEYLIREDPAEVDNSDLQVTPTEYLHRTGLTPEVDIEQYSLSIEGLVENPLTLSYEMLLEYETVTEVVLLICPGFFVDNAQWTGVPLATLLAEAGLKAEATEITFYAMDNYKRTLSLEVVNRDGVFLAYKVNGEILPLDHGYPLRLVVSKIFGNEWVKWINRIVVG
ncbi:molybdopterin-dependent oxidoreductase [Chloroflexota bacterium]